MRLEWLLVLCALVLGASANPEAFTDQRKSNLSTSLGTIDHNRLTAHEVERGWVDDYKKVASALETVIGLVSWGVGKPILMDIFYAVKKIIDIFATEPSVWQQVEMQVREKIKTHLHGFIQNNVVHILHVYGKKSEEFMNQLERLEKANAGDNDRKVFIDNMANHLENIRPNFVKFDFDTNKDTLKFDWALFNMYLLAVIHEQTVRRMLIEECQKLKDPGSLNNYDAAKWRRKLRGRQGMWRRFALRNGPEAALYLYFSDSTFQCKNTGDLECTDFRGESVKFKFSQKIVSLDGILAAKRHYQPISERIRKHFTNQILRLIGVPGVQTLNVNWPKSIFPGNCISPCGRWDESYQWCVKAKRQGNMYERGWRYCTSRNGR